jgi:hypothetical protein
MSALEKVIAEDLHAAIAAFKDDSFENVNIFANRIMSNSIFGENGKIFLLGFFLKDVALTFGLLKVRQSAMAFATAKSHGFSYIEGLGKDIETLDETPLWKNYKEYREKIRKFEINEWEEKNYTKNTKFTNEAFKWLLSYLNSNQALLANPLNSLIKGIITEMNRIYKVHSATLNDFIIIHLLVALSRNYEYACRIWNTPNTRLIDEKQVKEHILPAMNKIIALANKEFTIEEADALLWDLTKNWRESFIVYGELLSPAVAVQKGINLPEELKKKLTESLTKTMEKEL